MKLRIEFIPEGENPEAEEEIIIRCRSFDENIKAQCEAIEKLINSAPAIIYYKGEREFYLPGSKVLFFETDGDDVIAHTAKDMFTVNHRLYQLEAMLPPDFMRISKSAIVNTAQILSLSKNVTSTVSVSFFNSHKQVYASKLYYKGLKQKLSQRRI